MARTITHAARLGAALGAAACTTSVCTVAEPAWPIRPYYDFVHFVSIGHFECALESFADDATVVADGACPDDDPCIGQAAIAARYLTALRAGSVPLPLVDQRFDGRWLHTRGDAVRRTARGGDIVRPQPEATGSHHIELRDGRMHWLEFRWDKESR